MANIAQSQIFPNDRRILVRVVFLYVGQGSSAVVFARHSDGYYVLLVDINLDRKAGGIDVPKMIKDLLGEAPLTAFMNTHPHDDHVSGIEDLAENVTIESLWHSGHIPSKKYGECYETLKEVMKKVEDAGGDVIVLNGSRDPLPLGDAEFYILSPAEYVIDEVNEEEADARYRRIHEQCAVLKFGKGAAWIMIPGDADRAAFEKHITNYHRTRLPAYVLAASHHASRTFFREAEADDPYLAHIDAIAPQFVVISAPTQAESRHGHPHDDAVELYEERVGAENVLHTGAERYSCFFDIYDDGSASGVQHDSGELAATYGLEEDEDGGGGGGSSKATGPFVAPPSSRTGDLTPRKYG